MTWNFASGQTSISDTHVLSQSGRIVQDSVADGAAAYTSTYGYDAVGRLTSATVPYNALSYAYSATNACGANTAAGKDSDRTSTTDITTAPGASSPNPTVTITSCFDNADRLTSDSVIGAPANPDIAMGNNLTSTGSGANLAYDTHGNITQLGSETLGYDDTNRHLSTTLTDGTSITYQRDTADRVISMTQTPPGGTATTSHYSYSDAGDSSAFTLTSSNAAQEQTINLPGGATVSITATSHTWSYPGLSGYDLVTADGSGTRTGSIALYDPFGDPINPITGCIGTTSADTSGPANTSTPNLSNGFEGQHGKGLLTLDGIATIEMGARQYVPLLGLFLSVDPVAGGNANDYTYPNNPVGANDLTGKSGWDICAGNENCQQDWADVADIGDQILNLGPSTVARCASLNWEECLSMDPQDAASLTLSVDNWYLDEDKFSTKTYHVPLSGFTYTNQIWKNMRGHFTALNAPKPRTTPRRSDGTSGSVRAGTPSSTVAHNTNYGRRRFF